MAKKKGAPRVMAERQSALFYQQIGNAVCPPVIQAIAEQMLRCLGNK